MGAPGDVYSYSNSGMLLAGHVLERIEGLPWTAIVRTRVLEPLGIESSWTEGEPPRHDDVAGEHSTADSFGAPGAGPDAAPVLLDPADDPTRLRISGPCGGWVASPSQVVRWASEHLDTAGDGGLVPRHVREAMRVQHATKPLGREGVVGQCLGWVQHAWDGLQVLGHEGRGLGQTASLRVVPEAGLVVMVSTSVGDTRADERGRRRRPALGPRAAPAPGARPRAGRPRRSSAGGPSGPTSAAPTASRSAGTPRTRRRRSAWTPTATRPSSPSTPTGRRR